MYKKSTPHLFMFQLLFFTFKKLVKEKPFHQLTAHAEQAMSDVCCGILISGKCFPEHV